MSVFISLSATPGQVHGDSTYGAIYSELVDSATGNIWGTAHPFPIAITSSSVALSENLSQVGGAAIALGSTTGSASLPVVIASDQAAVSVKYGSGTFAISAASLPLPAGASTDATVANPQSTAGSTSAPTKIQIVGGKSNDGTPQYQPLPLAGSGASVIVSGTVTATIAANQSVNLTQVGGAAIAIGQAAMAASLPVAIASNQSSIPVAATLQAGAAIAGKFGIDQTTPGTTNAVSLAQVGTASVLAGAGASGTGAQRVTVSQDVTTVAGSAPGTAGVPSANVVSIQGVVSGTAIPISGSVSGTGNFTVVQGTASALNATVVGTGTFAVQASQATAASLNATVVGTGTFATQSVVTQPTAANLNATVVGTGTFVTQSVVTQATGTNLHAVIDSGAVTVSQATGTNLHAVIDSGSITAVQATAANLNATVIGTGTFAVQSVDTAVASATATESSVAGSASSVAILGTNSARFGYSLFNDSTAILYLRESGTAATTAAYTTQVAPGFFWTSTQDKFRYTGAIQGIWASAAGNARITEYT